MFGNSKPWARISIYILLMQFIVMPFNMYNRASAATVDLTPLNSLSASEMTQLNALVNASIPPASPQNQALITTNDYTPALAPDSSTPSPGTVREDVLADQDSAQFNAKVVFAPFDTPDIPLCATDVTVSASAMVAIDSFTGDNSNDTDNNAAASMAFFDTNDMSWIGSANSLATHSFNTPTDYGSPAVNLSFNANPITAAQYNAAKLYLAMDGSSVVQNPFVHRYYDWKDVSMDVDYDISGCASADLQVTTTVVSGATTILPGACEIVKVKLENLGPDDSGPADMDLIVAIGDDPTPTDFTLSSQPTAPTGAVQTINGNDITTFMPTTNISSPSVYNIDNIPAGEFVEISINACLPSSATAGQEFYVGGYEAYTYDVVDPVASNNEDVATLSIATTPVVTPTVTPIATTTTTLPNAGDNLILEILISMMILSSVLYLNKKKISK